MLEDSTYLRFLGSSSSNRVGWWVPGWGRGNRELFNACSFRCARRRVLWVVAVVTAQQCECA